MVFRKEYIAKYVYINNDNGTPSRCFSGKAISW